MFAAGGAWSVASAVVCERVLRAGAESGTKEGMGGLRLLTFVVRRGLGMATGAIGGWVCMERVLRDGAGSFWGGTLGRLGELRRGGTLGTPSVVCGAVAVVEDAAVMSSNAFRSVMSWVGAVMPLSAAAHAAIACTSLSVGVREG